MCVAKRQTSCASVDSDTVARLEYTVRCVLGAALVGALFFRPEADAYLSLFGYAPGGASNAAFFSVLSMEVTLGRSNRAAAVFMVAIIVAGTICSALRAAVPDALWGPACGIPLVFFVTMLLQLIEWPSAGRKMALSLVALDLIQRTPVVTANDGAYAWLPSLAYMAPAAAGLAAGVLPVLVPWPRLAVGELRARQEYAMRAMTQCVEVLLEGLSGNSAARLPLAQEHVSVLLEKVRSSLVVSRERLAEARWEPVWRYSLALAEDNLAYLDDAAVSVEVMREIYSRCDFSQPAHDRLMGLARVEARSLQTALVRALWLLCAGGQCCALSNLARLTGYSTGTSRPEEMEETKATRRVEGPGGPTPRDAAPELAHVNTECSDARADADCSEALAELRAARAAFERAYFSARVQLYYEDDGHEAQAEQVEEASRLASRLAVDPKQAMPMNAFLFEVSTLCNGVCERLALRSALLHARTREREHAVADLETGDASVAKSSADESARRNVAHAAALADRSVGPQRLGQRLRAMANDAFPDQRASVGQLAEFARGSATTATQMRVLAALKTSLAMALAAVYGFYASPGMPAALPAWTVAWISADTYAGANVSATALRALATVIAAAWAQSVASWTSGLGEADQLLVAAIAFVAIMVPASYVRSSQDSQISFLGLNIAFTAATLLAGGAESSAGLAGLAQQRVTQTVVGSACLLLVELVVLRVDTQTVLLGSIAQGVRSLHDDTRLFLGLFSGLAKYVGAEQGESCAETLDAKNAELAQVFEAARAAHSTIPQRVAPFAKRQACLARQRALLAHRAVEPVVLSPTASSAEAVRGLIEEEGRMLQLGLQLARVVRQACCEILRVGGDSGTASDASQRDHAFTLLLAPVAREIVRLAPLIEAVVASAAAVQRLGEPLAPTSEIERTDAAQPISMQAAPVLRVLLMASYTQATQALQENVRRQVAHVPSNTEVKLVNALVFALSELIDSLDRFTYLTASAQAERVLALTQRPYELSAPGGWFDVVGLGRTTS